MTDPLRHRKRRTSSQLLLAVGFLCMGEICLVAQNLVPNSSFEEYEVCPYTVGFQPGDRPTHWRSWLNSPDYFHACAGSLQDIDTLVDVPLNGWTFQYAWEGEAYVGVYAYDGAFDDYREYVGTELTVPLVVGCTYQLRFRTNPAYGGTYWLTNGGGACDNMGLLLTTSSNAWSGLTGPPFPYRNFAHLRATEPIVDTLAWTLLEGTIVADSAYTHVVLGNFFSDALTNGFANEGSATDITYYLVDAVEVVPLDGNCHGLGLAEPYGSRPLVDINVDLIHIRWPGSDLAAEVVDMAGRVIRRVTNGASSALTVTMPDAQGVYLLRIDGKYGSFVRKFAVP